MNNINNNRLLPYFPLTPDTVISTIIDRQSELSSLLDTINTRLDEAPAGTLRIANRGNRPQYYHRLDSNDRKGSYIKKKKELTLIKNLAQKEYDLRIKKEVECELQALTDFLKNYSPEQIEQAYDSLNRQDRNSLAQHILPPKTLYFNGITSSIILWIFLKTPLNTILIMENRFVPSLN